MTEFGRSQNSCSEAEPSPNGITEPALSDRIMAVVANVLRKRLPVSELPSCLTFHDLCIDALERVYIADEIEREWRIDLADEEIYAWLELEDVVRSVRQRLS